MLPNGSINPGEMTSFNHYALGAVVDWLHVTVGGISALEPGWKRVKVRPIPGGNLTHALVSFDGPYGLVKCEWHWRDGGKFDLRLEIPPNSSALVILPSEREPMLAAGAEDGRWVGSGSFAFSDRYESSPWPPQPIMPPFTPLPEPSIAE